MRNISEYIYVHTRTYVYFKCIHHHSANDICAIYNSERNRIASICRRVDVSAAAISAST